MALARCSPLAVLTAPSWCVPHPALLALSTHCCNLCFASVLVRWCYSRLSVPGLLSTHLLPFGVRAFRLSLQVFDVEKKYCTHNFKGHGGMVTIAQFHPAPKTLQLVTAGDDCKIMVWDLKRNACVALLKDHYR